MLSVTTSFDILAAAARFLEILSAAASVCLGLNLIRRAYVSYVALLVQRTHTKTINLRLPYHTSSAPCKQKMKKTDPSIQFCILDPKSLSTQ